MLAPGRHGDGSWQRATHVAVQFKGSGYTTLLGVPEQVGALAELCDLSTARRLVR